MAGRTFALGSGIAAFAASLCCLGPLVLGGLGFGAVLVSIFAPLRPYFLTLSAGLLVLGFYGVYRKPKQAEACEGEVCAPDSRTRWLAKPILWLATVAVLALAFFPSYGAKLVGTPATAGATTDAQMETVELTISGMTCEACAGVVRYSLLEVPGVTEAEVDYPGGRALVQYDPAKTEPLKLIEAVDATGYKADIFDPERNM